MNCEILQARLADYVAGELSAPERLAADAHLAECGACHRQANELSATERMLRNGVAPQTNAEHAVSGVELPKLDDRRSLPTRTAPAALRYVAVVALGFLGGYLTRDRNLNDKPSMQPNNAPARVMETLPVNPAFVARYQAAETTFPAATSFSRSLLVLARP